MTTPTIYPSYYRTAEVFHSNHFYSVVGQNRPTKEETTHLCLLVDGYKRWFPINELHACL